MLLIRYGPSWVRGVGKIFDMARFNCRPLSTGHVSPGHAGTAVGGPVDWSISDERSVDGNILQISIDSLPPLPAGYRIAYFELALANRNGDLSIHHLERGPATGFTRRVQIDTPQNRQRAQLRAVLHQRNQLNVDLNISYTPQVGNDISSPATGATAFVAAVIDNGDGTYDLELTARTGEFPADGLIALRGDRSGLQVGDLNGNTMRVSMAHNSTPQPGQSFVQWVDGEQVSATVLAREVVSFGREQVTLEGDETYLFLDETPCLLDGVPCTTASDAHCTHFDDHRVTLRSEWSQPQDVTPVSDTPVVTITATKSTCLQGQAVVLEAFTQGFQCTRPAHDLHYRFHVDKAQEQGTYAALPSWFDACFGQGSNNRAESYSPVWSFAPLSAGTVTVVCDVRDNAGNVATGTLELTVLPAVSDFADVDIYAASAALRPVPGAPAANIFTTLEELENALPFSGEALVLLDTDDLHGAGIFTALQLDDFATARLVIMPYNGAGVGPDAGARARMNRSLESETDDGCIFGLDMIGPFDPTDPFSISSYPTHGLNTAVCKHFSATECNLTGWRETAKLPNAECEAAFVDLYITDYQNFGFFNGDVGKHAISGCYTFTNPLSWRARGKSTESDNPTVGYFVDHGPYRSSRPTAPRGLCKSVFFSCCSWGGTGYPQTPVRWFGNANTDRPELCYNSELITEGSGLTIGSTTEGSGNTTAHPQNFVVNKIYHLTSMQPTAALSIGLGGVTVRNGVLATSSIQHEVNGSGVREHISTSNQNQVPGQNDNENNPIIVEFVTIADLRNDAGQNIQELVVHGNSSAVPMKNVNIRDTDSFLNFAPNFTVSRLDAEPLDTSARWTPLYAGQYFWNAEAPTVAAQLPDTSFATPPETTASYQPAPGSSAYQSAVGSVPYDDIQSQARPQDGTASKGAQNPI